MASRALSRGEVTTDLTHLTGGYFPVVSIVPCCRDGHQWWVRCVRAPTRVLGSACDCWAALGDMAGPCDHDNRSGFGNRSTKGSPVVPGPMSR